MEPSAYPSYLDAMLPQATQWSLDCACHHGCADCETVRFTNRDVEVIKCLSKRVCELRQSCDGMQICTCPMQRMLHGFQSNAIEIR